MSKMSWNRCRGKKTEEKFWAPVFVVVLRRLSFDFLPSLFSFVFAWRRFEVKQLTATQHFNTRTLPWPSVTARGLHDLESKYSSAWRTAALKKGDAVFWAGRASCRCEGAEDSGYKSLDFQSIWESFGAAPWIINDLKASDPLTLLIQLVVQSGLEGPGRKKYSKATSVQFVLHLFLVGHSSSDCLCIFISTPALFPPPLSALPALLSSYRS